MLDWSWQSEGARSCLAGDLGATNADLGAGAGLAAGASGDMYVASQNTTQGGTCEIYLDNFRFMRGYEYADVDFDVPTAAHSLTIP